MEWVTCFQSLTTKYCFCKSFSLLALKWQHVAGACFKTPDKCATFTYLILLATFTISEAMFWNRVCFLELIHFLLPGYFSWVKWKFLNIQGIGSPKELNRLRISLGKSSSLCPGKDCMVVSPLWWEQTSKAERTDKDDLVVTLLPHLPLQHHTSLPSLHSSFTTIQA